MHLSTNGMRVIGVRHVNEVLGERRNSHANDGGYSSGIISYQVSIMYKLRKQHTTIVLLLDR